MKAFVQPSQRTTINCGESRSVSVSSPVPTICIIPGAAHLQRFRRVDFQQTSVVSRRQSFFFFFFLSFCHLVCRNQCRLNLLQTFWALSIGKKVVKTERSAFTLTSIKLISPGPDVLHRGPNESHDPFFHLYDYGLQGEEKAHL